MNEYKIMRQEEYVKKYCANNYSKWFDVSKNFPMSYTQEAYCDVKVWTDSVHHIMITDYYYLCD